MTKKTGKSKSKRTNKDQRHLKAVPSAPKMPLQLVMNHRVLDSLAMDFMQWHSADYSDPADAFECLELVKLYLSAQHALTGSSSATAIDLAEMDDAVEAIASSLDPSKMHDALDDIYYALHSYIQFLKATGRWSGTDAAYEELHAVLGSIYRGDAPGLPAIQVPDLSNEEQDAAFDAMPLIRRATSLLDWIGTGKEVTSTGALRLKDIEPAAAAVGVRALGKRGARRPLLPLDQESDVQEPLLEVGTMHDVPVLRDIWAALVGAGLIRLGSTKAVPSPDVAAWNSPNTEERLHIRRMLTVVLLVGTLTETEDAWDGEAISGTLLAVLAAGTTAEPVPVAELEKMASLDLESMGLDDDLDYTDFGNADVDPLGPDGRRLDPQRLDPWRLDDMDVADIEPGIRASFVALVAKKKLAMLAELGLVEAEIDYRVPPVVAQCVDLAMGYLTGADIPSEGEDFVYGGADAPLDDAPGADAPVDMDTADSPSNVIALHGPSRTGPPRNDR